MTPGRSLTMLLSNTRLPNLPIPTISSDLPRETFATDMTEGEGTGKARERTEVEWRRRRRRQVEINAFSCSIPSHVREGDNADLASTGKDTWSGGAGEREKGERNLHPAFLAFG